jgi:hypothetical protein
LLANATAIFDGIELRLSQIAGSEMAVASWMCMSFIGEPVATPDQVRGKLSPGHAAKA